MTSRRQNQQHSRRKGWESLKVFTSADNRSSVSTGAERSRKERSTSDIVEAMKANGVSDEIMSKIENILTRGDAVRFAPVSREESKTDFQTMSTALEELDQHWSVK